MYYTFYKITNNINRKIYYGIHRTNDLADGYMGSGTVLRLAKKKYGTSNFSKEILNIFDNADDMYDKENEVVTESFIQQSDNYNMNIGGRSRVEDFCEQDYYKSGHHITNAEAARQLAVIRNHELKQARIKNYTLNPKICRLDACNNTIPYEVKSVNKYCSSSCAATNNNTGRKVTASQKEKVRKALVRVSDDSLLQAIKESTTIDEICNKVGMRRAPGMYRRIRRLIKDQQLTHLDYNSRDGDNIEKARRVNLILNSNINFTKRGWVLQVSTLLDMQHNRGGVWIKEHMSDFYKTCYKRKTINNK